MIAVRGPKPSLLFPESPALLARQTDKSAYPVVKACNPRPNPLPQWPDHKGPELRWGLFLHRRDATWRLPIRSSQATPARYKG